MDTKQLEWTLWENLPPGGKEDYTNLMANIEQRYINQTGKAPVEALCEEIMMVLVEVFDDR